MHHHSRNNLVRTLDYYYWVFSSLRTIPCHDRILLQLYIRLSPKSSDSVRFLKLQSSHPLSPRLSASSSARPEVASLLGFFDIVKRFMCVFWFVYFASVCDKRICFEIDARIFCFNRSAIRLVVENRVNRWAIFQCSSISSYMSEFFFFFCRIVNCMRRLIGVLLLKIKNMKAPNGLLRRSERR